MCVLFLSQHLRGQPADPESGAARGRLPRAGPHQQHLGRRAADGAVRQGGGAVVVFLCGVWAAVVSVGCAVWAVVVSVGCGSQCGLW